MRKPPTGEPCAGEPHARFGGRGGATLPDPYHPYDICNRFIDFDSLESLNVSPCEQKFVLTWPLSIKCSLKTIQLNSISSYSCSWSGTVIPYEVERISSSFSFSPWLVPVCYWLSLHPNWNFKETLTSHMVHSMIKSACEDKGGKRSGNERRQGRLPVSLNRRSGKDRRIKTGQPRFIESRTIFRK